MSADDLLLRVGRRGARAGLYRMEGKERRRRRRRPAVQVQRLGCLCRSYGHARRCRADCGGSDLRVAEDLTRQHGARHWCSAPCPEAERGPGDRVVSGDRGRDEGQVSPTLRLVTKKPWAIDPAYFANVRRPLYLLSMAVSRSPEGRHQPAAAGRGAVVAAGWPADAIRLDAYDHAAEAGPFYASAAITRSGGYVSNCPLRYFELLLCVTLRPADTAVAEFVLGRPPALRLRRSGDGPRRDRRRRGAHAARLFRSAGCARDPGDRRERRPGQRLRLPRGKAGLLHARAARPHRHPRGDAREAEGRGVGAALMQVPRNGRARGGTANHLNVFDGNRRARTAGGILAGPDTVKARSRSDQEGGRRRPAAVSSPVGDAARLSAGTVSSAAAPRHARSAERFEA